ncbi:hypothetical protein N9164_12600 [Draconibacterium sp.]|nr:hypothetical protein [Draconibacterium sp.]
MKTPKQYLQLGDVLRQMPYAEVAARHNGLVAKDFDGLGRVDALQLISELLTWRALGAELGETISGRKAVGFGVAINSANPATGARNFIQIDVRGNNGKETEPRNGNQ